LNNDETQVAPTTHYAYNLPHSTVPETLGSSVGYRLPEDRSQKFFGLHNLKKQFLSLSKSLALSIVGAIIVLGLVTGCQSAGSHASVRIAGSTGKTVQQTVDSVLQKNGYALITRSSEGTIFERTATDMDSLKWGGWGQGARVVIRLKVTLVTVASGDCVVKCDAFYVRDPGDRAFEDEQRLMLLSRKPYQKLLDEVKQELQAP
jgi:hypothetical protein